MTIIKRNLLMLDLNDLSGPIPDIITKLNKIKEDAELEGYTNIKIEPHYDYENSCHKITGEKEAVEEVKKQKLTISKLIKELNLSETDLENLRNKGYDI